MSNLSDLKARIYLMDFSKFRAPLPTMFWKNGDIMIESKNTITYAKFLRIILPIKKPTTLIKSTAINNVIKWYII